MAFQAEPLVAVKTGEYVTAAHTSILRLRKVLPNTSVSRQRHDDSALRYRKSRVAMSVVLAFELRKAHLKQKEKKRKKKKRVAGL